MTNKITSNKVILTAVFVGLVALACFMLPLSVEANPSQTPPIKALDNAATTTQSYMTAGTGTTTPITYDAFSVGSDTKFDQVAVAFQVHASGTPVTVRMRIEDSYNGVDWYPRSIAVTNGTTTIMSTSFLDYSFSIATSTAQLGGTSVASSSVIGITPRVHQSIVIDTPMRYSRVIFYLPAGSGPAAIWAAVVPIKEKQ